MPSVPAPVSGSPPPSEPTALFEHLLAWMIEKAPHYYISSRQWGDDPRGDLASYLRSGGALEAIGYREHTGRDLVRDTTTYVLCPWIESLIAGPERVCWLSRDPTPGSPRPVAAAQLRDLNPADHLLSIGTLEPLLRDIHAGVLDFGGERYRVVVQLYRAENLDEAIELVLDQGVPLGAAAYRRRSFVSASSTCAGSSVPPAASATARSCIKLTSSNGTAAEFMHDACMNSA